MVHKIYISPNTFESVIRACYSEEFNGMGYVEFDKLVNIAMLKGPNNTLYGTPYRIENETGALVGFFIIENGVLRDRYIRKTFRISSYLSAINQLIEEEMVLGTNASLSFSRNKILN